MLPLAFLPTDPVIDFRLDEEPICLIFLLAGGVVATNGFVCGVLSANFSLDDPAVEALGLATQDLDLLGSLSKDDPVDFFFALAWRFLFDSSCDYVPTPVKKT